MLWEGIGGTGLCRLEPIAKRVVHMGHFEVGEMGAAFLSLYVVIVGQGEEDFLTQCLKCFSLSL